jgi:phosphohistidine phosphatase SixA
MRLVVVRHAERAHESEEVADDLSDQGKKSGTTLEAFLSKQCPRFERALWHAPTRPARETAKLVYPRGKGQDQDPKLLGGPGSDDINRPALRRLVTGLIGCLAMPDDDNHGVVLVGHEPNVSRLVGALTKRDCRWLDPGEGVCVIGTLLEFKKGTARVEWATRRIDESELLKEKLQSKFAVSTFLAGFFIAALVELVKDPEKLVPLREARLTAWMRIAATICFSLALGLLFAAVYSYDRLAMPRAFWKPMPERNKPRTSDRGQFAHDFRLNGALYAYMIRTWK